MIVTHKIQCFPSKTQESIITQTLGACRWVHNHYLALNINRHKEKLPFTSAYEFSKELTVLKKTDEYGWLNEVSQKAVKQSIIDCEKAFKRFFKKKGGFPNYKSKYRNPITSYYLYPVNGEYKHNKIKLPLLGWVRIRENDYVFHTHIVNARIIKTKQNKYFIQMSTEIPSIKREVLSKGIGIDLGIKKYLSVACNDGNLYQFDSFIFDDYIKKCQDKIIKLQKVISNKAEINYNISLTKYYNDNHEEPDETTKNKLKGESYCSNCIRKVRRKIVNLNKKITDYKIDKIHKIVRSLVKAKPEFIAIENLFIYNMLSKSNQIHSKSLSKHISESKFRYFVNFLKCKCLHYNIETHIANKYFASSKKCCKCGTKKKDLQITDRIYKCEKCGNIIDRDLNAAINLLHMNRKDYTLI